MSNKRIATGDTIFASQLFTRQELVGRGAYGAVYKGIENATQQVVAIKVLNLDTEEDDVSDIQREIATLSQLKNCDSQNITRYHGSFLNGTKLWIVMDYAAGGSIRSLLQALNKIDEKCIAVIAREVLQALSYLHKHGIIHRDIKAANILLTDEGRVQLCDFGVAGQVTMNSLKRNSFVGTPYWMAPEVIKGQTYDYKADIWSLGITIYEIATGNPPFADQDPMRAMSLIPKTRPAQLEGDWSPAMKEFVALCLHEDPIQRPSAEDLLKTKWIKNTSKNPTALLKDLVAKFEQHKLDSALNKVENNSDIDIDQELESFDMEVEDAWRFDTTKTLPTLAPSRASSISRPSLDSNGEHINGAKNLVLSAQDSGVVMQGRGGRQSDHAQQGQDNAAPIPSSNEGSSPTLKAKSSSSLPKDSKTPIPFKSQPMVFSHESHPLLRLFVNNKSTSEEDVSTNHSTYSYPGQHVVSAPISLTIPNLDEITNARLASRSSVPSNELSSTSDQLQSSMQQQYQHQSGAGNRPAESSRLPFGFNMSKPFRFDRRPSAPILIGSAPGPDYPYNHLLNRGTSSSSPLTSPRAVPPLPQSSILAGLHSKQGTQDSDIPSSLPPKGSHSHEIIIPNQHQLSQQHNLRPNSTPASPAIPPTGAAGPALAATNGSTTGSSTVINASKEISRINGQRRLSPTITSTAVAMNQQRNRASNDTRSNLPPEIPYRKASLDFSQAERQSHLRPSLPLRPPSAAAVRSSTFHGLDSVSIIGSSKAIESTSSLSASLANISLEAAALNLQPINISEEKLPPFGHSPAHLRTINALHDSSSTPNIDRHRGSIGSSDKDGLSPALSVNNDPTFGQLHTASTIHHTSSLSSSSTSSASSTSMSNPVAANNLFTTSNPGPGVVMPRPGLRTVGSSENFARRIRSASVLRRNEDQDGLAKNGFQASRPPHGGAFSGQNLQSTAQSHYNQHSGYQQQQYPYPNESGSADIHRYRRASSPRRRSISMTNLNGGHSVIMIPPKKSSVDDYAPNPLLLPPSPSAARFIASSNITAPTLSSSPLRPALHTVASSSSLSSSFGSMSGTTTTSQTNGGTVSNGGAAAHGHQPINSGTTLPAQVSSALSSSIPTTTSSSPSSLPLVTNSNNTGTNSAATANNNNNSNAMSSSCATPTVIGSTNPKSVMNVTAPSYYQNTAFANNAMNSSNVSVNIQSHNVPITSTTMTNGSQQLHHHHLQNNNAHFLTQQTQAQQHPSIPMHMLIVPPEPRSLHLDALRKDDDLMEELQMTVHDLSQWLEVFETGIKSIRSS